MKPNCLFVGAAKSGTSSLYSYLSQHPEIFIARVKEPKFFTSDLYLEAKKGPGDQDALKNNVYHTEDYLNLFKDTKGERIVCEGSQDYLYHHDVAIPRIKEFLGDPYIIIMLRNPVERAFSAYLHLVRDGRETLSFGKALVKEEERIRTGYEFLWHLKAAGLYAAQVDAYLRSFSNVKIVFYEEFKRSPRNVIEALFVFLGLRNLAVDVSKRHNESKIVKNRLLDSILFYKYKLPFYYQVRELMSPWKDKIKSKLASLRSENTHKPDIDKKSQRILNYYFRADVEKLERLLKIELDWCKEISSH